MVFKGGSCREVRLGAAFDRPLSHKEGILLVTTEKGQWRWGGGHDLGGRQFPGVEKRET